MDDRLTLALTKRLGLRADHEPLHSDFRFNDSMRGVVRLLDAMLDRIEALEPKKAGKK